MYKKTYMYSVKQKPLFTLSQAEELNGHPVEGALRQQRQ